MGLESDRVYVPDRVSFERARSRARGEGVGAEVDVDAEVRRRRPERHSRYSRWPFCRHAEPVLRRAAKTNWTRSRTISCCDKD